MATYYKYSGLSYNQDTREFTVNCTVLYDDPNNPGTPQPYPGFDGISLIVTTISEAGIKATCQSFATKVETLTSAELAATFGVKFNLQGNPL